MEKRVRKEIGSFYEAEDIYEKYFLSSAEEQERKNFLTWINHKSDGQMHFLESGRAAILAVLESLEGKVERKVCLLPAYICEAVIWPFLWKKWEVHFFSVDSQLRPGRERMEAFIEQFQPSVILDIPYYGVDTLYGIRDVLQRWRRSSKGFLITDLTQSLFLMRPLGTVADAYVVSLRKWLPIFSGGAILADFRAFQAEEPNGDFINRKKKAQNLKQKYLAGEEIEKESFLKLNREAEAILDLETGAAGMDLDSYGMISVYDVKAMEAARVKNTGILRRMVHGLNKVKSVLPMGDTAAPLYYPVYTDNREKMQEFLRQRNIFAPVLWPVPELVQSHFKKDKDIEYIYTHLLALPCDQRYGEDDMARIGETLWDYERI